MSREALFEEMSAKLKTANALPEGKLSCQWLPGDASNRFYGRLSVAGHSKTFMLMVMNAPEAFKSEEVTGADEAKIQELPFVTIGRELESRKIRVPHIQFVDSKSQFLVAEDFGSEQLYDRRQKNAATEWYQSALKTLASFQKLEPFEPAKSRRFTLDLLEWEAEHFVEWAIEKNDKKISSTDLSYLRAFLKGACAMIEKEDYVLSHRDYHSKNLMILDSEKKVGLIDFQDALMGPPDYDLASLLRDSYVRFEDPEEEELLKYYETESGRKVNREVFGLVSLQRNMKAVGRFFYILKVKGRDTHIPYVKPTMNRIYRTLGQINESRLKTLLEGLFGPC